jgi:CubicO group peptidase (beta-lactamase class C family)
MDGNSSLQSLLDAFKVPGVAALVARGAEIEVASAGEIEPESIVRIASITKRITAAAVMLPGPYGFSPPG